MFFLLFPPVALLLNRHCIFPACKNIAGTFSLSLLIVFLFGFFVNNLFKKWLVQITCLDLLHVHMSDVMTGIHVFNVSSCIITHHLHHQATNIRPH